MKPSCLPLNAVDHRAVHCPVVEPAAPNEKQIPPLELGETDISFYCDDELPLPRMYAIIIVSRAIKDRIAEPNGESRSRGYCAERIYRDRRSTTKEHPQPPATAPVKPMVFPSPVKQRGLKRDS